MSWLPPSKQKKIEDDVQQLNEKLNECKMWKVVKEDNEFVFVPLDKYIKEVSGSDLSEFDKNQLFPN